MDNRPFVPVCATHGFDVRLEASMPCPWPKCPNGTESPIWAKASSREVVSYHNDTFDTFKSDRTIYERRLMAIAGDGMRSQIWIWVKRS
jgi:hypothetical protein